MNRLSKVILTSLAVVVTLVVLMLVAVNLYIQSPSAQARIQESLSNALRTPVRFVTTSISLGGTLKISGISIPDGPRNLLEATAFHARYRLAPIFSGRLEIYEMSVDNPRISWRQNAKGHWEVPRPATTPPTGVEMVKKEPTSKPGDGGKRGGLEVIVEGFKINNGFVELLDQTGKPLASFSGVNVTYTTLTTERMAGIVDIARVDWTEKLSFEKVHTPFTYDARLLTLPEITATLAGGSVTGSFKLALDGLKAPFTLGLNFQDVNAGLLSKQIHSALGDASGAIGGSLSLQGSSREIARADGTGKLEIRDGRFQKLELFEAIGSVLQIQQLSDLRLKAGLTEFRIGDEKAFIDNLVFEAVDLRLAAKGTIRFDGKIQLASKLSINEALRANLPGLIRGNFEPTADNRFAIDFDISGKEFAPRTNLLDKVVGKKITGQFDDLISSLFGAKKKKDPKKDDKKKKDGTKMELEKKPEPPEPLPVVVPEAPADAPAPPAPTAPLGDQ